MILGVIRFSARFSASSDPRRGSARYRAGMCAIFAGYRLDPGRRWRTSFPQSFLRVVKAF